MSFLRVDGSASRRRFLMLIAAMLSLPACPGGGGLVEVTGAVGSTAITSTFDLLRPFGMPSGVTARCGLTMLTDGKLIARCRFTNTTAAPKRFVYCLMIDLRADLRGTVSGVSGDKMRLFRVGSVVDCRKEADARSATDFHFGCAEVSLVPGESKVLEFASASAYVPPSGVTVKAQDFLVTYVDVVSLGPTDTFDGTNCRFGLGEEQGGAVVAWVGIDDDDDVFALWFSPQVPFEDPFIAVQPSGGVPGPKEYSLFEDSPCLPAGFEAAVAQLEPCPDPTGEPPPLSIDLNLFFFQSHMAPPEERFPAVIEVRTEGDVEGVRIETEPAAGESFEIVGGEERFGTLRACDARILDRCQAPNVPEGQRLTVVVNFADPASGQLLFTEVVTFLSDTEPPRVEEASIVEEELRITAADDTSSPLHAVAWFSTDEGQTWTPRSMDPEPGIEQDLEEERVPSRQFSVPVPEGQVRYFVVVQDTVFNLTFFGPAGIEG